MILNGYVSRGMAGDEKERTRCIRAIVRRLVGAAEGVPEGVSPRTASVRSEERTGDIADDDAVVIVGMVSSSVRRPSVG